MKYLTTTRLVVLPLPRAVCDFVETESFPSLPSWPVGEEGSHHKSGFSAKLSRVPSCAHSPLSRFSPSFCSRGHHNLTELPQFLGDGLFGGETWRRGREHHTSPTSPLLSARIGHVHTGKHTLGAQKTRYPVGRRCHRNPENLHIYIKASRRSLSVSPNPPCLDRRHSAPLLFCEPARTRSVCANTVRTTDRSRGLDSEAVSIPAPSLSSRFFQLVRQSSGPWQTVAVKSISVPKVSAWYLVPTLDLPSSFRDPRVRTVLSRNFEVWAPEKGTTTQDLGRRYRKAISGSILQKSHASPKLFRQRTAKRRDGSNLSPRTPVAQNSSKTAKTQLERGIFEALEAFNNQLHTQDTPTRAMTSILP